VDQEVGGSSPPSCTSKISNLVEKASAQQSCCVRTVSAFAL
jgi:hypothetical protein